MKKESLLRNISPPLQFFSFLAIILTSLIFTLLFSYLFAYLFWGENMFSLGFEISDNLSRENVNFLKYIQIINQIGLFIIPVLFFAFLKNRNISAYLMIDKKPKLFSLFASGVLIFVAMPFINWMVEINQMLDLPESLRIIEDWMKSSEKDAELLTNAFLNVDTYLGFSVNLLMIAIIPAIGEEFLFRGVFQRIFTDWFKNVHVAIIVTAFIFSAFHLQFYGFLPRFMLGVLFGYLFVLTGSLWVPIFVHFVNNAAAVIVAFLARKNVIDIDYEEFGTVDNNIYIWVSCIFIALILNFIYIKERRIKA